MNQYSQNQIVGQTSRSLSIGVLLGIAGALFILTLGLQDVPILGHHTANSGNGKMFLIYGSIFLFVFLDIAWLITRNRWKSCFIIAILCTFFSVMGMLSIGPFLFVGSLAILVQSAFHLRK